MTPRHVIVPAYLAACLLLGGASAAGFLANMLLQLMAIPILLAALLARPQLGTSSVTTGLMGLLWFLLALFIVQLIPLPPAVWEALPGRAAIAAGFASLGETLPWLPLSLAPQRTFYSLLWLLPSIAVLLGIVRLGAFRTYWLAWTIVGVTVVSVAVGAIQVASGERSNWYFYRITNYGFAVGFFANNNHMATLLLASMPFVAALKASALSRSRRAAGSSSGVLVLTTTILLIIAVGLAINTSLAGIGLAIPTAAASFLLARSRKKAVPRWAFPAVVVLALVAVVAVFSAPFGNNLTSDDAITSSDSRYTSISNTADAAADYFPIGSGIGTFQQIYRSREDPATVTNIYMNHAHSDLIEVTLETGLPGLALLGLLLLWWSRTALALWRNEEADLFARAATIASAAILAHSLVDYPLRTAALSAIFAVCLALMAQPRPKVSRAQENGEAKARHFSAD